MLSDDVAIVLKGPRPGRIAPALAPGGVAAVENYLKSTTKEIEGYKKLKAGTPELTPSKSLPLAATSCSGDHAASRVS